jgi:cytochrome c
LSADDYLLSEDLTLSSGKTLEKGQPWYREPDILRLKKELQGGSYTGNKQWAEKVSFGYDIITHTYFAIGEGRKDGRPSMAKGKVMSCSTCHIRGGTVPYAWPFFRTLTHFGLSEKGDQGEYWSNLGYFRDSRTRARDCARHCGGEINIPEDSPEMDAIVAWLMAVRDGIYPGEGLLVKDFKSKTDVASIPGARLPLMAGVLDMKANPEAGKKHYQRQCAGCHGLDGLGRWAGDDGFIFPPLAGDGGFSNAGGPVMVPVSASFIQRYMPLAQRRMPKQVALDIMAYVTNFARGSRWWQDHYFRHDPCARPAFLPLSIGAVPKGFPFKDEQTRYGPWGEIKQWLTSDECKRQNPKTKPIIGRNFDPGHPIMAQ